jgi:hypothetical protein
MSRIVLLALVALGGCKTAADGEPPDSPGESVAGTETQRGDRASKPSASRVGSLGAARSLVAVATVGRDQAQPCERVCGSLGDCLRVDDGYTTTAAGGLELQCLDLCVHAPEGPAKSEFLACGAKSECGQLQACAEQKWAALAGVRRGPQVASVIVTGDPCMTGCEWMFTCMAGKSPRDADLDPQVEQEIQNNCRTMYCKDPSPIELESWSRFTSCMIERCTGDLWSCWEQL